MSIYVEIRVRAPLDELWQRTQDPSLHERWDLRFSKIEYLPRVDDEPQRFLYETRIGGGQRIRGEGESTGQRDVSSGERTSALSFSSDDAKSLIRKGSGYWRYVPTPDGVRFLTWYDYETRFGASGRAFDRLLFRPLMGWATAWSFDRLRLWLEKGIDPALSMERSLVHATARLALAAVFLYQGLVPKLLFRHASELAMLSDAGLDLPAAQRVLIAIGVVEVVLGAVVFTAWNTRWPFAVIALVMPVALAAVALASPRTLVTAFNPVALNVAVMALAGCGWLTCTDRPSARRCLRARPANGAGGRS